MAVVVRETSRGSCPGRRALRRGRAVLGGLLVVTASATAMTSVILLVPAVAGLADPQVPAWTGSAWVLAVLVTASGLVAGRRLLAVRRGTVLWLRRFRYEEGTIALSAALDHIGRSWRVVTLDDAQTAPVGVALGLRLPARGLRALRRTTPRVVSAVSATGRGLTRVCVAGLVVTAGWALVSGEGFAFVDGVTAPWDVWDGPVTATAARVLVGLLLAEFAILLVSLLVMLAAIPLLGLLQLVGQVSDDALAAEAVTTGRVRSRADVEAVADAVDRTGHRLLAPRLAVLAVDTAVWQDTVEALARRSTAVLVDVSRSSENLVWELERTVHHDLPVVLVGHRDLVAPLALPDGGSAPDPSVHALRGLLDGHEILAYTNGAIGRWRFERALFCDLESVRPRRPRTGRDVVRTLVAAAALATFAAAVVATVRLVTGLL